MVPPGAHALFAPPFRRHWMQDAFLSWFRVYCYYIVFVCLFDKDFPIPPVLHVETEPADEGVTQQLRQANDAVARLEDELKQAVEKLRLKQKEFDGFRQRNASLWEKEIKARDSMTCVFVIIYFLKLIIVIITDRLTITRKYRY